MREDSPPADTRKRKSSAGLDCGVTRKGAPPARKNEGSAKNPPKGRFVRGVLYVAATLRQCTQDKKPRPTKHLGCNVRTRTFSAWTAENIRHLREFQSRTGSRRCRAGWLPAVMRRGASPTTPVRRELARVRQRKRYRNELEFVCGGDKSPPFR
jgi:hypothetical protein